MSEKQTAITQQTGNKSIEKLPAFLKEQVGQHQGMENVDQSDLLLPRLGLCQSLSPQRRKNDPLFIPGLEEGQLFNTVTQEIYGIELDIFSLFFFKNRIKYFPIDEGGGIDCISTNGIDGGRISPVGCASCKFSTWGNGAIDDEHGNDPPACTLYHNYMSYTDQGIAPTPLAISYKSTGLKASKQLLASIRLTNLPMFAKKYKVTVVEMREGPNNWFEKKLTPGEYVSEKKYGELEQLFNQLKSININIDSRGEEDSSFEHGANDVGSTNL